MELDLRNGVIAVVGIGYVGLPLAIEFGKKRETIAFDTNQLRIEELKNGVDRTLECDPPEIATAKFVTFTSDPEDLQRATVYIVTVPTPVDKFNHPDLSLLEAASEVIGQYLQPGDLVVYESTVYPGVTEDFCAPILEATSGLRLNHEFFVGYSPERINPGDSSRRLTSITKVTSGSTPEAARAVDSLYGEIIEAGTHSAPSIQVAEAAKVIENIQRDVNIALINELSILFNKLGLDTQEVLAASSTKWNFLPFQPGLVGGHCIGVDPYYLTHKAQEVDFHPEMILAGRRINDSMGSHIADRLILLMIRKGLTPQGAKVLVLGLAFKENCPDTRNTKVIDVSHRLGEYGCNVQVADPWVNPDEALHEYGIELVDFQDQQARSVSAALLAVAHDDFLPHIDYVRSLVTESGVIFDVKGKWGFEQVDGRL